MARSFRPKTGQARGLFQLGSRSRPPIAVPSCRNRQRILLFSLSLEPQARKAFVGFARITRLLDETWCYRWAARRWTMSTP